jgi:hypothetical protein
LRWGLRSVRLQRHPVEPSQPRLSFRWLRISSAWEPDHECDDEDAE